MEINKLWKLPWKVNDTEEVIKCLKEDESTKILPADKRNSSVIMDKSDYVKVENVLENGMYQVLEGTNATAKNQIYVIQCNILFLFVSV